MLRVNQLYEMANVSRNLAAQAPDAKTRDALLFEAATYEAKARRREVELGMREPLMQRADDPQA